MAWTLLTFHLQPLHQPSCRDDEVSIKPPSSAASYFASPCSYLGHRIPFGCGGRSHSSGSAPPSNAAYTFALMDLLALRRERPRISD
jgi:hypothetical protein